jgi:hypothetical protein
VIREDEDKDDDLSLIKLNSQFELENMQWIPKIVKCSKINSFKDYSVFEGWFEFEFRIINVGSISKIVEFSKVWLG